MLQDYSFFSEEDFIADEYFQQWVNSTNSETEKFWNEWLSAHPGRKADVLNARAFIENLHFNTHIPDAHTTEASLSGMLLKIAALDTNEGKVFRRIPKWKMIRGLAAAVLIFIILFISIQLHQQNPISIEVVTSLNEIKKVTLPDSSLVTLNSGSRLTYKSDMQHQNIREVWLEGEAYFNVTHIKHINLSKQFLVHVDDLNVEVLGTTFNIKRTDAVTNITLNTGKIKVNVKDAAGSVIIMEPGDFIQYSKQKKHITKKQVKPELYSTWKDEKVALDEMPLLEIGKLIEDTYGYKVHIEDKKMANTTISGTLQLTDEEALLETISVVLNIEVLKKGNTLYLKHKTRN